MSSEINFLKKLIVSSWLGEFLNRETGVVHTPEQPMSATDSTVTQLFLTYVKDSDDHRITAVVSETVSDAILTALLNKDKDVLRGCGRYRSTITAGMNVGVKLKVVDDHDGLFPIIRTPPLKDDELPVPQYRQITDDATYWFSDEFYEGGDDGSALEIVMQRAISGGNVEIQDIVEIYEALLPARPLERYYYLPLLVYLIDTVV